MKIPPGHVEIGTEYFKQKLMVIFTINKISRVDFELWNLKTDVPIWLQTAQGQK
jgi:hypothetical protein